MSTPASPHPPVSPTTAAPTGQSAGRGLVLITAAKIWFMVGASALGFMLPHLLPSQASFGEWGFVISVVSPINNVMVTATIQAVSKFASRGNQWVEGAKRTALMLQLLIGGAVAACYFFAAPFIAGVEHDALLIPGMRISTGVVVCYSIYAVFVGAANGAREFQKQAGLDATFTTLRTACVLGAAVIFSSVVAAVGGFVTAAAAVLVISVVVVGVRPVDQRPAPGEMLRFMAPVALYLLVLNLLMFVDGYLVKRLIEEAKEAAGLDAAHAALEASKQLAVYTAVQQISRIPYQAILSVTFVIFPLISQSTFAADAERTRGYIERSIRLSLLVVLAMAAAVAASPEGLLSLFPKKEYLPGGPALAVLMFGYVAFSMLSIAGTIINGTGRTRPTTVIAVITLVLDVALTYALTRLAITRGGDPLLGAAAGTTLAIVLGAVLSLIYLQRNFGASLPLRSAARAAVAVAAAFVVGRAMPFHGLLAVASEVLAGLTFFATLALTKELTLGELKRLLGRGKPA